jgi:D-serine deaminase-like pyridoxal phosphate-dependent protein
LIVSTLAEAEFILPLLLEYKSKGRAINVCEFPSLMIQADFSQLLYGFPFPPSSVSRLAALSKALGPGGLSLMVDHPSQLPSLTTLHQLSGGIPSSVFLKIDQGYGRAGVLPNSPTCSTLLSSLLALSTSTPQICNFLGLYSHAGHSYSGGSRVEALNLLRQEFEALRVVAESVKSAASSVKKELVLSVGATPTTTSMRNLLLSSNPDLPEDEQTAIKALRDTIDAIRLLGHKIEVHAGVYPTLDLQQLSTHALPSSGPHAITFDDLALTIITEVASLYPG